MNIKRYENRETKFPLGIEKTVIGSYICTNCLKVIRNNLLIKTVYYNQCRKNKNFELFERVLENGYINESAIHPYTITKCGNCKGDVISVDYRISSHIISLISKGYKTLYSCSGHKNEKNIYQNGYIYLCDENLIIYNFLKENKEKLKNIIGNNYFKDITIESGYKQISLINHKKIHTITFRLPDSDSDEKYYKMLDSLKYIISLLPNNIN